MQAYKIKDRAYVNIALIAVNVLIFLYFELIGDTEDTMFMIMHGAVYEPLVVLRGEYYRLFTSMFLHFGASHLVNNMLVLFVLGERMEQVLGHVKYLIFYIVSGIAANIISIVVHMGSAYAAVSAGASGAIFGVVGGLVYVVAANHGQLDGLANRQLGFMIILSLYHGFTASGVDNWAHIGGLFSGFILSIFLYRRKHTARIFDTGR
ncbi:rhomboid family intramembrane serine protease [Enterocloster aldenensis]|uniref:rhomboid family intramembrane serine protease n=1 Tax=Enterocloster aldenensis TaxID=358742 RepID=UPI004028C15E